jgi:hypothetical protein
MIDPKIIKFDDKLFQIIRVFNHAPDFPITEAKEYYGCDRCLRRENELYFCRTIEDAQVIEETYE